MYHTIMVPLDGSLFSEHALPLALRTARQSNAALHLVHVQSRDQRQDAPTIRSPQHEQAYLTGIAERLSASWGGPIATALLEGPATETIATYAEAHQIDLVIMTTHGRGTLSRAWLGSVADDLIRRLPMPMVLVRPHEADPASLDNHRKIEHILIPLDGSEWAERMVPHATAFGRLTSARYTLLQTVEIVTPSYGFGVYATMDFNIDDWIAQSREYLERIANGMRAEGLQVQTDVFVGPSAVTILDYARDHDVGMVAIETHGRSGAARLVLGSVADKIVRGSGVPVLLHRPAANTATP